MTLKDVHRPAYDISIVVPIYNVEDYLEECLNSLLNQQFSGSIQILLVNDCSPDNSGKICEYYTNKYQEIEYFVHEKNLGSAGARNTGLNHVSGKYFVFVDPDDLLAKNGLKTLFEKAEEYNADIAKGSNIIKKGNKDKPASYNTNKLRLFQSEDILSVLFNHEIVRGHPWGKIFRTKCFQNIRFTPGVTMAQDLLYCAEAFAKADKLVVFPENVYSYRIHSKGATGKKYQTNAYLSWLNSVEQIGSFSVTEKHKRSHRALQVRTLVQIVRETRKLTGVTLETVVKEIKKRELRWGINIHQILIIDRQSIRTLLRFVRYKKALRGLVKMVRSV